MEIKTIAIIDYDYFLRREICVLLQQNLPRTITREYILAALVLAELKRMNLDMMITGNELLDGNGESLALAARRQMPLLPIITLVDDLHDQPSGPPLKFHRFIPKSGVNQFLVSASLALLHNDSLVRNVATTADSESLRSKVQGCNRSGSPMAKKVV